MRYTPAGGTITLSAKRDQESVLLKVTDTGAGILPQNLPHIFDRFYRADQARQQAEGESGLGLAIAKSIVEAHGGKISAASKPGRGSTFMVALPVD
jgi:two-component system sensor histidine kinase BaeS